MLGNSREELGGSEYLKLLTGRIDGIPPQIDLTAERALHRAVIEAAEASLLQSAHDLSEGGLAVALTESLFSFLGAQMGATIELETNLPVEALLFSESHSRMLVSVRGECIDAFQKLLDKRSVPHQHLGTTGGDRLTVSVNGSRAFDLDLPTLHDEWWHSLERKLRS